MENLRLKGVLYQLTLFSLCVVLFGLTSCNDDVKSGVETEESIQVASYLEGKAEYSEFVKWLKEAGLYDLMNSYGVYTCFIPDNDAVAKFYRDNNTTFEKVLDSIIPRLEGEPENKEEQRYVDQLVRNHILVGKVGRVPLRKVNLPIGSIVVPNMNDQFLRASTDKLNKQIYYINDTSKLIKWDKEVHNGIVHTINNVLIAQSTEVDKELEKMEGFSLFHEALVLTGMIDSLALTINENYEYQGRIPDIKNSRSKTDPFMTTPERCQYGYTILMESDETFLNAGIENLNGLIRYAENVYYKMFPLPANEAETIKNDPTHRQNALNRFVSYHMMDRMADINELINPKWTEHFLAGTIIREYIEMMMPNSMIEIQSPPSGVGLNVINNKYWDCPVQGKERDLKEYWKTPRYEDEDMIRLVRNIGSTRQVMFHEISNILTYEDVEDKVFNKRLRIDVTSMIPEFVTNKIRGDQGEGFPYMIVPMSFFNAEKKTPKITITESSQFQHIGSSHFHNMYGDEFLFVGKYDFTLTTPPIPAGKWEVRLKYTPNSVRGVAQIFLNGKPCGIPQDLRITADKPQIGSIKDVLTPDNGVENDKMMRNRGYMKGSGTVINKGYPDDGPLRDFTQALRKIIAVEETTETKPFVLRAKSVLDMTDREYQIDYMEFVRSDFIEYEGRD
ncbi:fasciclin domain-containing protein [Bacteroidales bacterium OttesenSCG-928-M06]|nr:fasciclin domain-containing protein [Bacteroidales bacterium OttesenSCG-928-M06]